MVDMTDSPNVTMGFEETRNVLACSTVALGKEHLSSHSRAVFTRTAKHTYSTTREWYVLVVTSCK